RRAVYPSGPLLFAACVSSCAACSGLLVAGDPARQLVVGYLVGRDEVVVPRLQLQGAQSGLAVPTQDLSRFREVAHRAPAGQVIGSDGLPQEDRDRLVDGPVAT